MVQYDRKTSHKFIASKIGLELGLFLVQKKLLFLYKTIMFGKVSDLSFK